MSKKLLRKKLALMLATLKKKRPYYCEVEYLESSGTQYIDTGILPSEDLRTKVVQAYTGTSIEKNSSILGSNGNGNLRYWINYDNHFEVGYGNYLSTSVVVQPGDINIIDFNYIKNGSHYFNFNGTEYAVTGTPNTQYSIILFGRVVMTQTPVLAPQRIYKVQFIRNDVLIGDFIPVLDWDMTPCMYDRVSGQLFYNQGTGDFGYGREIHEVEYLESTGTQYINTGYSANANTIVEYNFNLVEVPTSSAFFGSGTSGTSTDRFQGYYESSLSFSTKLASTTTYSGVTLTAGTKHYSKMGIPLAGYYIDDTFIVSATGTPTSLNLYVFARNINGSMQVPIKMKLYDFKISENNSLVRDYIPAIDENGVGFMFDRVSHTIYDNAGTSVFKYPARELEYLESTGTQYINTGVVLSSTDKVEASVEYTGTPTQGSSYAFGTFGSNKNFGINCTLLANPKNWYGVWYNQGTLTSSTIFSDLNTRYNIQVSSNGIYINDNLLTTVSGTFTGSVSAYLFWANGTGQPKSLMRLYSCKMWQNGVLVRDYIPSIKDGVLGLFDKVNDVFYDNDGTGTFVAGKVKEDLYI